MSLLVCLLCFSIQLAYASGVDVREFVFNGFGGGSLAVDGSATVTQDGVLVLTDDANLVKGHGMYPRPLRFHARPDAAARRRVLSFSTTFVFAIFSEYADVDPYGLAFFVAGTNNFSTALPSEYFGLFNTSDNGKASNHVLAIELDTLRNVDLGDMDSNHVGIDINGLRSVKAATAGYHDDDEGGGGAFHGLRLMSGEDMQVWVNYDSRSTTIDVTLAPARAPRPKKPLLSHVVDLSDVIADTAAYVGFASSLGDGALSRHCVLAWSFSLDGPAPPLDYSKLPAIPHGGRRGLRVLDVLLPVGILVLVLALGSSVLVFRWRRRLKYGELREDWEDEFGPRRFTYKDLFRATGGFTGTATGGGELLGVGGFGSVYKGVLSEPSSLEVAVKRVSHDSKQGIKEFVAEITSIGRLQHRNLVRLLGYCRRRGELLLVYEYMPNGSLDRFLYGHGAAPAAAPAPAPAALEWSTRFQVIKDIARGLVYLHSNSVQVIVHRDIKASNVLLDGEMSARLGDFGLARLHDHGGDPRTTRLVGTVGYLAPELAVTSKATPATDVFAFGVFVLEVACGRRPIDHGACDGSVLLVDRVLEQHLSGEAPLAACADARLRGEFDAGEVSLALRLGLLCAQLSPVARPSMMQVVQYLDGGLPPPELQINDGDDSYAKWYKTSSSYTSMSATSHGTVSDLSGGR